MDPSKKNDDEIFDLGNFSDQGDDDDTCGGDNKYKSNKDPSKKKDCSTNPDQSCECKDTEQKPKVEPVKEQIDPKKLCKKCKEKRANIKYRMDPVCRECYIASLCHRFRASLRNQCSVGKEMEELIMCVSGGQASLAMCQMASDTLFNPSQRKMFFKSRILHINDAAVHSVSEEEEESNLQKIKRYAEHAKFELDIINIEDIYDMDSEYLNGKLFKSYNINQNSEEKKTDESPVPQVLTKAGKRLRLIKLLTALSDNGSSKDDMVASFRKLLMLKYALDKKLNKLFVAESGQKIATKSLALLCKGRGGDIFNDLAIQDKRFEDVTIMRPMNEFLTKEILVYCHFGKLSEYYISYPKLEDNVPGNKKYPGNGSIDTLLENFVDKLQAGFPSTVHTVLNTLNKIKPKFEDRKICPVCFGNKDKLGNILEKGSIIQHLKKDGDDGMSVVSQDKPLDMEFHSKKIKEDYLGSEYFQNKHPLEKVGCFACGRTFENAKDPSAIHENFPDSLRKNAETLFSAKFGQGITQQLIDDNFYDYDDEL